MHELIVITAGLKMVSLIVAVLMASLIILGRKRKSQKIKAFMEAEEAENKGWYVTALTKYELIGFYEDAARCAYEGWKKTHNQVYSGKMEKYVRHAQNTYNNTGRKSDYEVMRDIESKYGEMKEEYEISPESYLPHIENAENGMFGKFFPRSKNKRPVPKRGMNAPRPKRKGRQ